MNRTCGHQHTVEKWTEGYFKPELMFTGEVCGRPGAVRIRQGEGPSRYRCAEHGRGLHPVLTVEKL
jgi:hypothetical protein